jgi:hypothetical protein
MGVDNIPVYDSLEDIYGEGTIACIGCKSSMLAKAQSFTIKFLITVKSTGATEAKSRYATLSAAFQERYDFVPELFARSPGTLQEHDILELTQCKISLLRPFHSCPFLCRSSQLDRGAHRL